MTQKLHDKLKALAPQKPTDILKQYLPLMIEKIKQGVSQKDIYLAIRESGIDIKENTFRTFINRHMKKQLCQNKKTAEEDSRKNTKEDSTQNEANKPNMSLADSLDASKRAAFVEQFTIKPSRKRS